MSRKEKTELIASLAFLVCCAIVLVFAGHFLARFEEAGYIEQKHLVFALVSIGAGMGSILAIAEYIKAGEKR